jgi:hypothetical protein
MQALLEYDSDECGPLEHPEDDETIQVGDLRPFLFQSKTFAEFKSY